MAFLASGGIEDTGDSSKEVWEARVDNKLCTSLTMDPVTMAMLFLSHCASSSAHH